MRDKQILLWFLLLCLAASLCDAASAPPLTPSADTPYLYKVSLVQAAPGKLLELIDLYKARAAQMKEAGDETPLWMRHSQGDHWDLMILYPVGSYADYYQAERVARRARADQAARLEDRIRENIAWQEDLFAYGPPLG